MTAPRTPYPARASRSPRAPVSSTRTRLWIRAWSIRPRQTSTAATWSASGCTSLAVRHPPGHHRVEPQPGIDCDRQARRNRDHHASREERRQRVDRLHRERVDARLRRRRQPQQFHPGTRGGADLHGQVHPRREGSGSDRGVGVRLIDLDRRRPYRPQSHRPRARRGQRPTEVHADASASGSKSFQIVQGSNAPLAMSVSGLVGVTPIPDSVTTGAFDAIAPVADADTKHYTVVVPAGTKAARFSLDAVDDTADLDLYVTREGRWSTCRPPALPTSRSP